MSIVPGGNMWHSPKQAEVEQTNPPCLGRLGKKGKKSTSPGLWFIKGTRGAEVYFGSQAFSACRNDAVCSAVSGFRGGPVGSKTRQAWPLHFEHKAPRVPDFMPWVGRRAPTRTWPLRRRLGKSSGQPQAGIETWRSRISTQNVCPLRAGADGRVRDCCFMLHIRRKNGPASVAFSRQGTTQRDSARQLLRHSASSLDFLLMSWWSVMGSFLDDWGSSLRASVAEAIQRKGKHDLIASSLRFLAIMTRSHWPVRFGWTFPALLTRGVVASRL